MIICALRFSDELQRGIFEATLEVVAELARIIVAQFEGDRFDGRAGIAKQCEGFLQSLFSQPIAGRLGESATEVAIQLAQ
jgi:hypothetical protein